jgi:hypothetical protein
MRRTPPPPHAAARAAAWRACGCAPRLLHDIDAEVGERHHIY